MAKQIVFLFFILVMILDHSVSSRPTDGKPKHVVFIGDSLMRYQYLSWVHQLELGVFPTAGDYTENPGAYEPNKQPNVCREGDYRKFENDRTYLDTHHMKGVERGSHWQAFMIDTSRRFNGNEHCDCWRGSIQTTVENRFYYSKEFDLHVTYFTKISIPVHGHYGVAETSTWPPAILDGNVYNDLKFMNVRWNKTVPELADVLAKGTFLETLPPMDMFLYNEGAWSSNNVKQITAMAPVVAQHKDNVTFIWKTTTRKKGQLSKTWEAGDRFEKTVVEFAKSQGWMVFDAHALVADSFVPDTAHYWDVVHFMPWVYSEINFCFLADFLPHLLPTRASQPSNPDSAVWRNGKTPCGGYPPEPFQKAGDSVALDMAGGPYSPCPVPSCTKS